MSRVSRDRPGERPGRRRCGHNARRWRPTSTGAEGLLDDAEGDDRDSLRSCSCACTTAAPGPRSCARPSPAAAWRCSPPSERWPAASATRRVRSPNASGSRCRCSTPSGGARDGRRRPRRARADQGRPRGRRAGARAARYGDPARGARADSRVMAMALAQVAASHREVAAVLGWRRRRRDDIARAHRGVDAAERLEAVDPDADTADRPGARAPLRAAAARAASPRGDRRRRPAHRPRAGLDDRPSPSPTSSASRSSASSCRRRSSARSPAGSRELAAEAAGGPVRLVKMIGDAAMFTSPEPALLARAVLELIELVEEEDDGFPGVAPASVGARPSPAAAISTAARSTSRAG